MKVNDKCDDRFCTFTNPFIREKLKNLDMKREIKFRAWFPDTRVMISFPDYGFNYEYGELAWESDNDQYDGICNMPHDYNKCLIMQFTGLKDKNGKEIYEGDIVMINHWKSSDLFDYSNPFEVTWRDGQIDFVQGEYHNFIGSLNGKIEIEVIGNIYENPTL